MKPPTTTPQRAEQQMLGLLLSAKNAGLAREVERAVDGLGIAAWERRLVRGEDVPAIANALALLGRRVVGLTGDDLLNEWLAAGNKLAPQVTRATRPWTDPAALFGSPALCLMGAPNRPLSSGKRVAICNKYRNLAECYLRSVEVRAGAIERVYISGALENVQLLGLADFIIDIVVTGATAREAGLVVHDILVRSALAVLTTVPLDAAPTPERFHA
jgi:ATP phosphoribosyltransferase